jgi:septal ring factor EnvC (AmiA/AmiB activator)
MPYSLPGAAALVFAIALLDASPLSAQAIDSTSRPHVMAAVVVKAPQHRATATENRRLSRELREYDERIMTLKLHLDSLKTYADSLDRDRVYLEAATAQARARRAHMEQRLRELEARKPPSSDAPSSDARLATP